jgi:predicted RNase H-like HicB family nuclease
MTWDDYIEAAVKLRKFEFLDDDGEYFCHIPELQGAWATGPTVDACVLELREVLIDWIQIGIELGHTIPDLPGSDGPVIAPSSGDGGNR